MILNICFSIKDRIEDILKRKNEYETSDSYQDLKKEKDLQFNK